MEIDVTDVVHDSMIAGEPFIVVRRAESVNNYGERTSRTQRFPEVYGSIQPTGSQSLVREEAFQTNERTIKVITDFLLRGVSKENNQAGALRYDPDIVIWDGDSFEVRSVENYSKYGAGFVEAECVSVDFVDQATNDDGR